MIKSMTGFGDSQARVSGLGKMSVEIRSLNHKFLDIVMHLPTGFLSLEEEIKKELQAKIKRGRITCSINIMGGLESEILINKNLLKNYMKTIGQIKREFHIADAISLNNIVHLPGVLSVNEGAVSKAKIWPYLKKLINTAVGNLDKMRRKEGKALYLYLKKRARGLNSSICIIQKRYAKAIPEKLRRLETDEERSSLLKTTDITEEIERLAFHISNFMQKLSKNEPVGKELDFIAQEMQREINTIGAKCPDKLISGQVVQIKSQIEKLREQAQNIE